MKPAVGSTAARVPSRSPREPCRKPERVAETSGPGARRVSQLGEPDRPESPGAPKPAIASAANSATAARPAVTRPPARQPRRRAVSRRHTAEALSPGLPVRKDSRSLPRRVEPEPSAPLPNRRAAADSPRLQSRQVWCEYRSPQIPAPGTAPAPGPGAELGRAKRRPPIPVRGRRPQPMPARR